jgi:hypothetical protein
MPPLQEESSRNLRKTVDDAGVLPQLCNPALTGGVSELLSGDRK